ncbi:hypothetical protein PLICRDRAFT_176572 [Plicaturopsis crispa FD-325 SS-3]|nr:hypothetical protein PLICRDRAFT_176572 [Plicaturopsis crispa FD-325 SS-3]
MDEVVPGLWIGDLPSALNTEQLKAHNIHSILSAMRGRVSIHETFIRHQIMLDDTDDADVLTHFLPSIAFIEAELEKGRGVLVHCQAGMSRSATIVAAFLMHSRNLDRDAALDLIRKARPCIQPNDGFMQQLDVFQQASFKISRQNKATRMFYLDRVVDEVMNGDGTLPGTDMFAKFPRTPSDSVPGTPAAPPRRRIRCKIRELATREHMLDHGQLGPATPAAAMLSPATSRRGSETLHRNSVRRPSRLGSTGNESRPGMQAFSNGILGSLTMSAVETNETAVVDSDDDDAVLKEQPTSSGSGPRLGSGGESLEPLTAERAVLLGRRASNTLDTPPDPPTDTSVQEAKSSTSDQSGGKTISPPNKSLAEGSSSSSTAHALSPPPPQSTFVHPADLAAQLYSNPKLAALRSPGLPGTPTTTAPKFSAPASPPILANPKCSGYFVEPMKWMEPFLASGQLAGKIVCPNQKCGAKLGNYDWAGVCCSCKEWVTPGFCIHRSRVDEFA